MAKFFPPLGSGSTHKITQTYVEVPLSKGMVALVSPSDYERVSAYKWYYGKRGYATHKDYSGRVMGRKNKHIYLHHFILGRYDWSNGETVDHINRDPLDNRRENLRVVSLSKNLRNIGPFSHGELKYKGVGRSNCKSKPYRAYTSKNRKYVHIGNYETAEEAAHAYDIYVLQNIGEGAYINSQDYNYV